MRRKVLSSTLGASLLAGVMSSCGGSTEPGTNPISKEEFSEKASSAYCDHIPQCCATFDFAFDAAACKSGFKAYLDDHVSSLANLPGVVWNADAAGECVAWFGSASCEDGKPPKGCADMLVGTVASGDPCSSDAQCAIPSGGDAYCDNHFHGGTSEVCVQQPRGKLGDTCAWTCTEDPGPCYPHEGSSGHATCWANDGLFCDDATLRCTKLAAVGGVCTDEGCVADAYCSGGTCLAKVSAGGSCENSQACKNGFYCGIEGICQARKPNGSACADYESNSCVEICENGTCVSLTRGLVDESSCKGDFPLE